MKVLVDGTETYCFIQESQNGQETTFRKIIFEPVLRGGGWVGLPEDLFKGKSIVVTGANLVDGEMRKSEME